MTTSSERELREKIRNAMECDDAEHLKDPTGEACYECQVSKVMHLINEQVAAAVEKTDKAYGGCHICYGKGYATVNDRWAGTDEWTGKRYETGSRNAMKFCSCERGKQLIAQLKQRKDKTDAPQ